MAKNSSKVKDDIQALRNEILKHEHNYYILDNPVISDSEFDSLLKKLEELESQNPQLITPDSPTQRVGGKPREGSKTLIHEIPMLSLDNTYNAQELREWEARNKKAAGIDAFEYLAEPKVDGVSCALIYKNGLFDYALTRGDGRQGEDVTVIARTIHSIPLKLNIAKIPQIIEVRGEVYLDKSDFEALNRSREQNSLELFANPRNAAGGTLKLLDPVQAGRRKLKFIPHSFGLYKGDAEITSHKTYYDFLKSAGFNVTDKYKICASIDEVIEYCLHIENIRSRFPYEIDGIVVKVNDYALRGILKQTQKSPRWAAAYKFPASQATTTVEKIVFQVGRTGIITPVARLKPVECGGVVISRATLHNFDEIKRLAVGENDTVLIERAGDVIPKIVKVTEKSQNTVEVEIPPKCPVCGSKVVKEKESDVAYRCVNPFCPAQLARGILHFASRAALDIEGLGESAVEQLVERGYIKDVSDIFSLKKADLLSLELFKDKKADNLLSSINRSRNVSLERFVFALGIKNVGEKAAMLLSKKFGSIDNIAKASQQELMEIHEIGAVTAESVVEFFANPRNAKIIERLKISGINPRAQSKNGSSGKLEGMKFVFTGELESLTRIAAKQKVAELGGEVGESVSAKTTYVVAGENPGSKYRKAEKLGIPILTEADFLKLLI